MDDSIPNKDKNKNKVTLITNVYNEEYYLPFWLEYHRKIFDHGIVIDYDSTDRSIEIISSMCPTWEIRRTENIIDGKPLFETYRIEEECRKLECSVTDGYKIYLNTTEWLIIERPLKEILDFDAVNKCYLMNVYLPLLDYKDYYPVDTKEFIRGFDSKIVAAKDVRGHRFIFNRDCGHYYIGRHFTHIDSDYDVDINVSSQTRIGMSVFWCGYYPLNESVFERKLQIKNNMKREIEYQPHIGRNSSFQHFFSKEQMIYEFYEYFSFNDLNNSNIDFKKAFEYMRSIL